MRRERRLARRVAFGLGVGLGVSVVTYAGGAGAMVATVGSALVIDDSLRSRDVKNGTLQLEDLAPAAATGLRGSPGPSGARGDKGDKGDTGEPAPASIADTVSFVGPVQSIAANSAAWVFAGPPASVSTTSTHHRVVAAASAALGFAPGSADGFADLGLCYRLSSGGIVVNFAGGQFTQHAFSGDRLPYSATATVVLPAGDFLVGLCVRNSSNRALTNNSYVNGFAQVTS